jgi:ABC-type microcin C transport system permease subunit YejE
VEILLVYLLFTFTGITNSAMHPIHVSVCNLELNDKENIVSLKLFKDDFALALKNKYQLDIPMEKADEKINSKIISNYVNSCLQIELNKNKNLSLDYYYSEINEDAIWIYFKTENIYNATKLKIKNVLMLDIWDDQTNLLIINWKGKENGYRFDRHKVEIEIDLNT